jgi:hypothetical protein
MYAHVSCYFRCTLHTLSLSGSGTDDVVHTQKELGSLRCRVDHRTLELVALDNAQRKAVYNGMSSSRMSATAPPGVIKSSPELLMPL